jgi:hypothetical protein
MSHDHFISHGSIVVFGSDIKATKNCFKDKNIPGIVKKHITQCRTIAGFDTAHNIYGLAECSHHHINDPNPKHFVSPKAWKFGI